MKNTKRGTPNFEILMSTTNNSRLEIDQYDYTIINQILDKRIQKIDAKNVWTYYQKGVTKSKNKALKHANGEICLLSDDDVIFKPNIDKKILKAFKNNPKADIITFQIETPEGEPFKNYDKEKHWHDIKSVMKVSMVEIAFRRKVIIDNELGFDESFGLGTNFPTGSEFIFLTDALKKGLNILYIPEVIVVHPKESSGQVWDAKLIQTRGAMLYRVFGWKAVGWVAIFTLKQHSLSNFSMITFFYHMLIGIKNYINKTE